MKQVIKLLKAAICEVDEVRSWYDKGSDINDRLTIASENIEAVITKLQSPFRENPIVLKDIILELQELDDYLGDALDCLYETPPGEESPENYTKEMAPAYIESARDQLDLIMYSQPRLETPEQYKARTGEDWPDDWAVYYRYVLNGAPRDRWRVGNYKNISYSDADFRKANAGGHQIVCATEAGPPPDGWEPEGGA